jgi:2-keto-4-pentenoate hydratase
MTVLEALRRQLVRRQALLDAGATHLGWKIGAGIPEVGEPVIGYLTSASVLAPGAAHDTAGARELYAETELIVHGASVGVAIELVDTARPPDTMAGIVENNVFHRAAVLGHLRAGALRDGAVARIWVDGELRATGPVTRPPMERVAELLSALGEQLRPTDAVLAGALTHVPVNAGNEVVAAIDGLDRVAVTLSGPGPRPVNDSRTRSGPPARA